MQDNQRTGDWVPEESAESAPHTTLPEAPVVARIPDVGSSSPGGETRRLRSGSNGRVVSQGLSTQLVVGGGVLLILAAVVPLLWNRNSEPKPGTSPAPDADVAPPFDPQAIQSSVAGTVTPSPSYQPDPSFQPNLPPALGFAAPGFSAPGITQVPSGGVPGMTPVAGGAMGGRAVPNSPYGRPMGMSAVGAQQASQVMNGAPQVMGGSPRTAWDNRAYTAPGSAVPSQFQPAPAGYQYQATPYQATPYQATPYQATPHQATPYQAMQSPPSGVIPSGGVSTGGISAPGMTPRMPVPHVPGVGMGTGTSNPGYAVPYGRAAAPTATLPGTQVIGQPQAQVNQTMTIPGGATSGGAAATERSHWLPSAEANGNPAKRSWTYSRTDQQPTYQADTRAAQPGVARLQGTIEKPSLRTTHDRARPGIY